MSKKKKMLMFGCIIFASIIVGCIFLTGKISSKDTKKIGFILSGSKDETGWNGMHYLGAKSACEELGTELLVKENVKEFSGQCEKAIKELVDKGANMIILSSYGYSEEVYEVVKEYPDITFYGNSSEYHEVNMTSYFVRMYQARYLAGIVAGMKSETGKIGYVAAMENNEVNRGISAFTLGVRSVNPEAEVIVSWSGSWDDKEAETLAAQKLISDAGVDLLTYHQNQLNVVDVAEEKGIYSIGYHQTIEEGSSKNLTTVICNWEKVYEEIIRSFLIGKANLKNNFWVGMEVDAIGLSEYSEEITDEIVIELDKAKSEILSGKEIFSGEIYDNEGNLRCKEKETISDEMLLEQFDWFVEGVVFYEG